MIRETYDAIKGAPGARSARVALDAFWKTERLVHDSDPLISTLFQMRDGDHHGGGPELHVAGGSRVTVAYALQAGEHAVHSDDGFWVVKNEGTPNEERFQPPQIIHKVELNSTIVGRVTPHLHRDLARDETSPASVLQLAISYFDDLWHRTRESPPLLRHFPEPDQAP